MSKVVDFGREDEPTNIKDGRLVGFTDEILANMFAVPKDLCGSKFELKAVCCGSEMLYPGS
jgi:hypothetical protein